MKTALLVIDYINGIIGGSCKDYAKNHPILANTNKLIKAAREHNIPIYFVRLAFDSNYTGAPKHSKMFNYAKSQGLFQIGNKDTEFVEGLNYQKNDVVINKTAASPFHCNGDLTKSLISQNIERLIFAGVATDNAIDIGVREAHDAGYYTIIAEDTCGASSEEFHQWTMTMLQKIANEILTVEALLQSLSH